MDEHDPLHQMAALARELSAESSLETIRSRLVEAAPAMIGSCSGAGLTIVNRDHALETAAATGSVPRRCDELQYELGEGPCLDAVWVQLVVHSPDLRHEVRWPTWAPRVVAETDVRSMLCVRLWTRRDELGALNLYSDRVDGFDEDEREEALVMGAHAAVALGAAREAEGLTLSSVRRTVLGQATGVLMERYRIDASVAFEVLRRVSSQHNRRVYDIAVELVESQHAEGL